MILEKDIYGVKIFEGIKDQKLYSEFFGMKNLIRTWYDCKKKYHLKGEIKLCKNGYHFSPTLDAALQYKRIFNQTSQRSYAIINPVCIVKAPKESEVDISDVFPKDVFSLGFGTSDIKIASSDIEIERVIPFNILSNYIRNNHLLIDEAILNEDNTINIMRVHPYAFIEDYDEKGIIIENTSNWHITTTLFINFDKLKKNLRCYNIPLKITNKTKYTQYLNIVYEEKQCIVNIPRFSTKVIDSDVLLKSDCTTVIEYPKNRPPFYYNLN